VALTPLHRLAAYEAEGGVSEDLHGGKVARLGELGERAREKVVAGRARDVDSVRRPDGGVAAPHLGPVDQVVVHERRHMEQLDRDSGRDRRLSVLRRAEEDEHRTEALASRGQRLLAHRSDDSRVRLDRTLQPGFEYVEVRVEASGRADVGQRRRHSFTPVCSATIPPAKSR
jgi:hypothetical protein